MKSNSGTVGSNGGQRVDTFAELVTTLYATRLAVMASDGTQRHCRQALDTTIDRVLNHFGHVRRLSLALKDNSANNAHLIHELRLQFSDGQSLKHRPTQAQLKKLQFDLIAAMAPNITTTSDDNDTDEDNCPTPTDTPTPSTANTNPVYSHPSVSPTPWFDKWKHMYIETYEQSDHDFIGAHFGCFFVITDHELETYKDIIASFITQVY
ncbi:unnamed protein product, partial [Medioppia subpectinata]